MDCRDRAGNTRRWFITLDEGESIAFVEREDEDGGDEIPFRWVVCPTCRGKGTHVNPNIDAHGITAEEWDRDWSFEDRENYRRNCYDVACYECQGRRVVPEPLGEADQQWVQQFEAEEAEYYRACTRGY